MTVMKGIRLSICLWQGMKYNSCGKTWGVVQHGGQFDTFLRGLTWLPGSNLFFYLTLRRDIQQLSGTMRIGMKGTKKACTWKYIHENMQNVGAGWNGNSGDPWALHRSYPGPWGGGRIQCGSETGGSNLKTSYIYLERSELKKTDWKDLQPNIKYIEHQRSNVGVQIRIAGGAV
jgi:hypothetical protein